MDFIEMSGAKLLSLLNEDEYQPDELRKAGVTDNSKVRINRQGDIEVLSGGEWEVVGGLIGDFLHRIEERTGLSWKFQR
ncbi:MAG TPA: hypothetical protein VGE52_15295 [Pirellulales bacterium]